MRELGKELRATVELWRARLMGVTDEDASERRYEGSWSSKEIIGHLIDSASNNHQRFVRLQFAEYLELPGYEQASWVRSQRYHEERWADLVELWHMYNHHLAHVISRIPDAALHHRCKIGDYEPMTLEFIATDYLRHLRHHLEQVATGLRLPTS